MNIEPHPRPTPGDDDTAIDHAASHTAPVSRTPSRLGLLVRVPLALVVLVGGLYLLATQSLPYAVAETQPELALWLNPSHPAGLEARAEQLRGQLFASAVERSKDARADAESDSDAATSGGDGDAGEADAAPPRSIAFVREQSAMRDEIRDLAERLIAVAPLNATGHRLLGEVSDDVATARQHMTEAVKRSRRESVAVFWLMNDRFLARDYDAAMTHVDVLLRTRPGLARQIAAYVADMSNTPDGRAVLIRELAKAPPWRGRLLSGLRRVVREPQRVAAILLELNASDNPPTAGEQSGIISTLIRRGQVTLAYSIWLQLQPPERLASIGFINNPSFERQPEPTPFDWSWGKRASNAVASFNVRTDSGERAAHIAMFGGRVRIPPLTQTVVLGPGRYTLTGQMTGAVQSERGLVWSIRCLSGKPLAETAMLLGNPNWAPFEVTFDVPNAKDCQGQTLSLRHDSRSASEQLASGEIWFDNMKIERAKP